MSPVLTFCGSCGAALGAYNYGMSGESAPKKKTVEEWREILGFRSADMIINGVSPADLAQAMGMGGVRSRAEMEQVSLAKMRALQEAMSGSAVNSQQAANPYGGAMGQGSPPWANVEQQQIREFLEREAIRRADLAAHQAVHANRPELPKPKPKKPEPPRIDPGGWCEDGELEVAPAQARQAQPAKEEENSHPKCFMCGKNDMVYWEEVGFPAARCDRCRVDLNEDGSECTDDDPPF